MHLWRQTRENRIDRRLRVVVGCLAATLLYGRSAPAERPPRAEIRIPLERLGMPGFSHAMLASGASLASIHLLDDTHALLTFGLRKLVPRLPGDESEHQDRLVAAELVELPSGKVLAKTEWHLHDHGRYLWSIGKGLFLVRMGDDFFAIAPLEHHAAGDAFRRIAFPHREGHPLGVLRSPDGEVLTVETRPPETRQHVIAVGNSQEAQQDTRVTLDFYRLDGEGTPDSPVSIRGAGAIVASQAFFLALDGDGYLWPTDKQRGRWSITFNGLGGVEPRKLMDMVSSCSPRLEWVSRSQFVTLSCRGDDQSMTLTAWGMDGHETWEEPFNGDSEPASFVAAPAAGRFAVSRVHPLGQSSVPGQLSAPIGTTQEVRVYQTESGDMLLRVNSSTAFKTGENFDLSSDGRRLAVLTGETLDLYSLPAPTKKDRQQMAEADEFAPPRTHAPVLMSRVATTVTRPGNGAASAGARSDASAGTGEIPVSASATAPETSTTAAAVADGAGSGVKAVVTAPEKGDGTAPTVSAPLPPATDAVRAIENSGLASGDQGPRKPPTLLKPGEKAEFKPKGH